MFQIQTSYTRNSATDESGYLRLFKISLINNDSLPLGSYSLSSNNSHREKLPFERAALKEALFSPTEIFTRDKLYRIP